MVKQEVARLCPNNPLPCLMAAKVCLEHLNLIDDGFSLATEAVRRAEKHDSNISSRWLIVFFLVITLAMNSIVLTGVSVFCFVLLTEHG